MRKVLTSLLATAAFGLLLQGPAQTCSLGPGYLQPSNFEAVRAVDAIVLAKAIGFVGKRQVRFELEGVLKGDVSEKLLTVEGYDRWLGASDPLDFSKARPGAGAGACIAYDYRLESRFLLFLSTDGRKWDVSMIPFARVNEEVSGQDAPWTKAVVEYVRIAALPTIEEQKKALRELATKSDGIPGLKADIEAHFKTPYGSKPFEDLKDLYDQAIDEVERDKVLWAFARGKHTGAADLVRGLVSTGAWKDHVDAVCAYAVACSDPTLFRFLIRAAQEPGAPEKLRAAVVTAAADGADATVRDEVLGFMKSGTDELADQLSRFFLRNPRPEAVSELHRRVGDKWVDQWSLTLKLAALGDPKVLAWALEAWKSPGVDRWVSVYVLAISPLASADEAAQNLIKAHSEVLESLAQGYGESSSVHRVERLLQLYELKPPDPSLRKWVRRSLETLAYRRDQKAKEALAKMPDP